MIDQVKISPLWGLNKKDLRKIAEAKDFSITKLTKELEALSASYAAAIDKNIDFMQTIKSKDAEIEALRLLDGSSERISNLKAEVAKLSAEVERLSLEGRELNEKLRLRENEISILRAGLIREQNNGEQKSLLAQQAIEKDKYISELELKVKELEERPQTAAQVADLPFEPRAGEDSDRLHRLEGERDRVLSLMIEMKAREDEVLESADKKAALIMSEADTTLFGAQAKAKEIVFSAQKERDDLIDAAKKEGEGLIAAVRREGESLIEAAKKEAAYLIDAAQKKADESLAVALLDSSKTLADAKKEAERLNIASRAAQARLAETTAELEDRQSRLAEINLGLAKLNERLSSVLVAPPAAAESPDGKDLGA